MELDEECKGCLYNSQLKKVEREQPDSQKVAVFKQGVKALCGNPPAHYCAPLLMRDIDAAANYIDFARLCDLNEDSVSLVLAAAERASSDKEVLQSFKEKLKNSQTLCYLHDNCGEIVLDKILIRVIRRAYPDIAVTSVVRGKPIINDVTEADAREVGLYEICNVINNASGVPGTYLNEISKDVKKLLAGSDIIISKGLGNLETLYGEGYKIFYAFTCKCEHIAKRFSIPLWSAAFIEEK